jgi:ElaB/YqjD/DUF883 family membrane-anchored ribosome-binding protein
MTNVELAEARAKAARERLTKTINQLQYRLKPSTLAQGAIDNATESAKSIALKGAAEVRARPVAAAAVAGAVGLFLSRGWISRALTKRKKAANERETDPSRAG